MSAGGSPWCWRCRPMARRSASPTARAGAIPVDELKWARKVLADGGLGPVPRQPAAVLAPGDVVLVEPLAAPAQGLPAAASRCARSPKCPARLVALDPHTGRVLALETGGFSYEISQFDRATQAQRQTGSAIKPFVYLAALDHGFTPSTLVLDAPLVVDQGPGLPKWNPTNYEHKFFGPVAAAASGSRNRSISSPRASAWRSALDAVGDVRSSASASSTMCRTNISMLIGAEARPRCSSSPPPMPCSSMAASGSRRRFIDRVQDRDGMTIYRADQRALRRLHQRRRWHGQPPPELPDNARADRRSAQRLSGSCR